MVLSNMTGTEGFSKQNETIKLNSSGEEWKKMRNMSTPVFTSGKLRLMVPHISRCGANLEEMLGEAARVGDVLDAKELFGKFALDAIASSSFGIESNSFKDPESLFRINAMKLTRYLIMRSWLSTIDD